MDKPKEWQMELLMEKLRSKSSQFKTFAESAKAVKMSMLEKRYLDSVEKNQHQKCLDTLQHSIKVTSLLSMVERLESLTRQLGLKFMVGASGVELFISSEMFYLEIVLDANGTVQDVKVHHEGKVEQQSCIELVNCLSRGDFADFTAQLEGLSSIYQINAEKKIKCKAFSALQALELDLSTLAQLQTFIKDPFNILHKSPVGILEKRKGGHAMKLTYFVSPYDLLDIEKGTSEPLTVETVTSKNLGYSVTVCMEGSGSHKLQTTMIISVNRTMAGKNTPSYAPLSNQNSAILPACFVLKLNKPLPMCATLVRRIQQITDMECGDLTSTHPLMSLITQHFSDGQLDCAQNKGLFVTLPDQHHCYFMTESKSMDGILINNIPFTHPCHVPQILGFLRQQALFNSVVASCIRPCSKQDLESMIMFEVSALSWQHLSISLEHPLEESMATAELDLSDISNVNCKIYTPTSSSVNPNQPGTDSTSELASKILHRCLSIPITMRCVIKLWDEQANRNGNENFSLPLGAVDPGGHNGNTGNPLADFGGLDGKIKQEHGNGTNGNGHGLTGTSLAHPHQSMFLSDSIISASGFPSFPGADASMNMLNSIEIGSLLSGSSGSASGGSTPGGEKPSKRSQKRKASEELWKNPKRKPGEDEMMMETSSSDSTSMGTPTSHDAVSDVGMATPNSALGFHSDLELSGLDAPELNAEKAASEYDSREAEDLGDVEEMLAASATSRSEHKARKLREERKSSLLLDLGENKNLVPPSVSITPITTTSQSAQSAGFNQVLTNMGLERRPGIEIIPITSTPATSLPSSITITPISSSHTKPSSEERRSDKKSSKSRSDDKSRLEKKRKRKRDEEAMGPPDKLPPKPDPLSKPVSVSIKPAESPPLPGMTPTSPSSMLRKYSSSPTHQSRIPLSGKSSPSMLKPISSKSSSSSSSSSHHSPKHSPAHVVSSPKHSSLPGMSSPKNHGTSPKHPSASSSGKPSMSTLKSAASSPSSKSDSVKVKSSSNKDSRDKEKKLSSNVFSVNNPKVKTSSIKLKQVDLSANVDLQSTFQNSEGLPSPSGTMDLSKSSALNQVRNRKGSLSAVIDKLKSAQHCGAEGEVPAPSSGGNSGGGGSNSSGNGKSGSRDGRSSSASGKVTDQKTTSKVGETTKNSEYMVKPSSDGMKITINKTRTKESSKSSVTKSTSSGTGSPKTHTGLKPGVNSGPASKKPQQVNQKSNTGNSGSSASSYSTKSGSSGKVSSSSSSSGVKTSSSSSNLGLSKSVSKLTGSPKTSSGASDLSRSSKDGRPRINKSSSDKSIFSSSKTDARRASPTSSRDETDSERAFKLLTQHSKADSTFPSALMEGMMKTLDKNFQIPKLSNRTTEDKKLTSNKLPTSYSDSAINNIPRAVDANKMYDMIAAKSDISLSKYPLSLTSNTNNNLKNNLVSISSTSPLSFTSSVKDLTIEPAINMSSDLVPTTAGSEISKPKDLSISNSAAPGKDEIPSNCKLSFPISAPKNFPGPVASEIVKPSESLKFSPQHKLEEKKPQPEHVMKVSVGATSNQEAAEMLLDFSSTSMGKPAVPDHIVAKPISLVSVHRTSPLPLGPPPSYPASPSVSVHIVKSPAPSPLVNPSPHSASPCITDDELMDEALVGLGK